MRKIQLLFVLLSVLISYAAKGQETTKPDTIPVVFETKCRPGILWTGWQIQTQTSTTTFTKTWEPVDVVACPIVQYYVHLIPNNASRKKVKRNNE